MLRRLSLDLTGLPPTPEEVAAFVADASPGAYEEQVDRLLASPHFGERMAVWWLDVARFTDTVGFHGDQNQRIFPYRDYVIRSFNENKHFDQFTIEQLAGDLLPHPTTEQLVATGYNRLNMMTREGGAQPNEYLAKYGAQRVRAVAAAWFGSTFGCAECHDHKFDPIKTRDFYELKSFFADIKQWGVYADYGYTRNPELAGFTNEDPFPPEIKVESPYLRTRPGAPGDARTAPVAARGNAAKDAKAARGVREMDRGIPDLARSRKQRLGDPGGQRLGLRQGWQGRGRRPRCRRSAPDPTVRAGSALGKTEELRLTVFAGRGRIASVRIDTCSRMTT